MIDTNETSIFTNACPDWCTLAPDHDAESVMDDGRLVLGHGGPDFGSFGCGADEYADAPGVLEYQVQIFADAAEATLTVEQLRQLGADAGRAAAWLEARLAERQS